MKFFWPILQVQSALTAYSREYIGWRPMEPKHSLVEILLAEGQLKLYLALTIFSREYFGRRPMETQHFLVETLLAKGQLQLFFGFNYL